MLRFWPLRLSWRLARRILVGLFLVGLFYISFLWHLGNLTVGMSGAEATARSSSANFSAITHNPVYAPHKLIQLGVQLSGHSGAFWLRAVSVAFASAFLMCLYLLLKAWFGKLIALFGLTLFLSTPLLILSARSVSPNIMLLSPLAVIAAFVWLARTEHWPNTAWIVLCVIAALASYTPGVLWLIAAGVVFGRQRLVARTEQINQAGLTAGVILFLILLIPVAIASVRDLSVLKNLLLIPGTLPDPLEFLKQAGWSLSGLVWKSRSHFDLNIARLPLLTAAQLVLSVLGLYTLLRRAKRDAYFLITVVIIAVAAIGLGQDQGFSLFCLPVFGLSAAAGLRYLHFEWQTVFPRNPLPKVLAVLLMATLVSLQLLFGLRYALVAWPHTTETKTAYVLK